jgi:hypothetical protein
VVIAAVVGTWRALRPIRRLGVPLDVASSTARRASSTFHQRSISAGGAIRRRRRTGPVQDRTAFVASGARPRSRSSARKINSFSTPLCPGADRRPRCCAASGRRGLIAAPPISWMGDGPDRWASSVRIQAAGSMTPPPAEGRRIGDSRHTQSTTAGTLTARLRRAR